MKLLSKILITFIFSIIIHPATAQVINECGTPSSSSDFLKRIPSGQVLSFPNTKVLKLYLVIYSDDDGSNLAIDENTLKREIKFTDSVFNIGDICFSIVGIEYRMSTYYNNTVYGVTDYTPQKKTGVFNAFVVKTISDGVFGYSNVISDRIVIKEIGFGARRTFIHELGHALGLDHTFKGTAHDPDNTGTDELVNGTNGTTAGDFVTDTPADPYNRCGTGISSCSFPYVAPDCADANNSSYSPQMTNYMGYWPNYGCNRTVFTAGQYTRMRNGIDNNATLSNLLATDNGTYSNATISSGIIAEAKKISITINNYTINGNTNAVFSAGYINLLPNSTFRPGALGIVQLLGSYCY
ncbi:MAG: M43 family zinc metalloprotease [Ferruginibacter sp.]